jgi:hypothetical protein
MLAGGEACETAPAYERSNHVNGGLKKAISRMNPISEVSPEGNPAVAEVEICQVWDLSNSSFKSALRVGFSLLAEAAST